jgi:hypothetical protein
MKKIIFIVLLLLMTASVSAIVVKVYPPEVKPGANDMVVVVLNNEHTIENSRITVSMPDFDLEQRAQADLKSGKVVRAHFEMDLPKNAKGYYPVRVTVADENGAVKNIHSWVYVG